MALCSIVYFYSKDGGDRLLRKVSNHLQDYTVPWLKRLQTKFSKSNGMKLKFDLSVRIIRGKFHRIHVLNGATFRRMRRDRKSSQTLRDHQGFRKRAIKHFTSNKRTFTVTSQSVTWLETGLLPADSGQPRHQQPWGSPSCWIWTASSPLGINTVRTWSWRAHTQLVPRLRICGDTLHTCYWSPYHSTG